ncbi:hypothetical protein ACH0B5_07250 [Ureibacillus sp. 179-F W5.1 NHS]|uniref:hypothetical protein n=1 Tax=Ureibacillus sp. 179-F W5.1 NHS TaxID=3374297 RepID=UPI0038797D66
MNQMDQLRIKLDVLMAAVLAEKMGATVPIETIHRFVEETDERLYALKTTTN